MDFFFFKRVGGAGGFDVTHSFDSYALKPNSRVSLNVTLFIVSNQLTLKGETFGRSETITVFMGKESRIFF